MWVFGYGSLIFRPGFDWLDRRPAVLDGWRRRWWQASPDHRGTVKAPGRVVTLERGSGRCWGVAYRLDAVVLAEVMADLDHREKAGYERYEVLLRTEEGPLRATVYVAGPTNPNFLGPAPPEQAAAHIARSHGPSGANADYLLHLADALRELGAEDPETFDLAERVRRILSAGSPA